MPYDCVLASPDKLAGKSASEIYRPKPESRTTNGEKKENTKDRQSQRDWPIEKIEIHKTN
jgi:hypothetical protein